MDHTTASTVTVPSENSEKAQAKRKPKVKDVNPIESAIRTWLSALPEDLVAGLGLEIENLLNAAPKRWVVYSPMVLLPSGSFGNDFTAQIQVLEKRHCDALWDTILVRIGKREGKGALTHLAINSGIPLNKSEAGTENILRSPSGLVMLFGDFGPDLGGEGPKETDFENAFWVSTKQNGITQIWAPRWTMFSRGNVKEKARLLAFHQDPSLGLDRRISKEELGTQVAVDLYAGIGYFVFSYVGMGIGRVFGWELNPWSVEGLRRGSIANGCSVKVVKGCENWEDGGERIVIFEDDNRKALERLRANQPSLLGQVGHVNGGLLPTSQASWEISMNILEGKGWLHLHENVGVNDVEQRKAEIEQIFRRWLNDKEDQRQMKVEHVEFVKTFAPGVWHCVFDIYISDL